MLEIARAMGVRAHRDERGHGVWTARGKLGAVGIRVRDDVTLHGLALNVSLDLSGYGLITPCGVPGLAVTSLAVEGAAVEMREVVAAAEAACRRSFDDRPREATEEARP